MTLTTKQAILNFGTIISNDFSMLKYYQLIFLGTLYYFNYMFEEYIQGMNLESKLWE